MNSADLKTMAINLSSDLKWDGVAIMRLAQTALTDANFHTEAAAIGQLIAQYN